MDPEHTRPDAGDGRLHPESTSLERAFALARAGECAGVSEIRNRLRAEGYRIDQLEGPMLQRQLREICRDARKALNDE
jgi:hypothetical protein